MRALVVAMPVAIWLVGLSSAVANAQEVPGSPVVQPPPQIVVNQPAPNVNVTFTPPPPDPALVASTAQQGAPAALQGGLVALDQSGAELVRGLLDLGGGLAGIRKDLTVDQPRVRDVNHTAGHVVLLALATAIAAAGLVGLLAPVIGSDGPEVLEVFLPIPLYALAALTSLFWLGLMLDGFGAVAAALSGTTRSAVGPALGLDFASLGSTLAELVLDLAFLVLTLLLVLKMWLATVYIALLVAVAPLFVFAGAVPGGKRFSGAWWRMTPGWMTDLLLISAVLAIGGPVVGQLGQVQGAGQVFLRLGLVLVALRIPGLFGANNPDGGLGRGLLLDRLLSRALPGGRAAGAAAGAASAVMRPPSDAAPSSSPSGPSRVPRGYAATWKANYSPGGWVAWDGEETAHPPVLPPAARPRAPEPREETSV